jgi:hypothetical protein
MIREGMISRSIVDVSLILKFLKVGLCPRASRIYIHVMILFFVSTFYMASMLYQDETWNAGHKKL